MIITWLLELAVFCLVVWLVWKFLILPVSRAVTRKLDRTYPTRAGAIVREAKLGRMTAQARKEAADIDREAMQLEQQEQPPTQGTPHGLP